MDWSKGFSASYFGMYVDPYTWQDTERFEILGGSITTKTDGLRVSASITCTDYDTSVERWVRIYMESRQGDESARTPMFTGLATSPNNVFNGKLKTNTLTCYSPLKVAEDLLLQRGWFAPEGSEGAALIRELLKVIPAPVDIASNSPVLRDNIIAEDNETNLTMVDKILTAINWRIIVRGDGTIEVKPLKRAAQAEIEPNVNDIVAPEIETTEDWFSCPNVLTCYDGTESIEVRDDSDSKVSVPVRGREIQRQETDCKLNNDESLAEYAKRRLKEEQYVEFLAKYQRRFLPDVVATDVIKLRYPEQGVVGEFMVYSQNIELTHGAEVTEEVVKI